MFYLTLFLPMSGTKNFLWVLSARSLWDLDAAVLTLLMEVRRQRRVCWGSDPLTWHLNHMVTPLHLVIHSLWTEIISTGIELVTYLWMVAVCQLHVPLEVKYLNHHILAFSVYSVGENGLLTYKHKHFEGLSHPFSKAWPVSSCLHGLCEQMWALELRRQGSSGTTFRTRITGCTSWILG